MIAPSYQRNLKVPTIVICTHYLDIFNLNDHLNDRNSVSITSASSLIDDTTCRHVCRNMNWVQTQLQLLSSSEAVNLSRSTMSVLMPLVMLLAQLLGALGVGLF